MLRLAAVTRAAWRPTAVRHAAAVGRKAGARRACSAAQQKTRAPRRKSSVSPSRTRRKKTKEQHSAAGRSADVAGPVAAPLRGNEVTRTTPSTYASTTSITAAPDGTGGSISSSHAAAKSKRARLPSASRRSPPPNARGWNASVEVVQRRMRSRLAQLVLLSPIPLRPSQLFAVHRRVLDADTAGMLAWASYAVHTVAEAAATHAAQDGTAEAGPAEGSGRSSSISVAHSNNNVGSSRFSSAEWATLQRQGESFTRAYHASVVPLMKALHAGDARADAATAADPDASLPAAHEVERWVYQSLLFTDPEFRVTFHGGYVCYPVSPALLLATVDPVRDHAVRQICFAAQWKTRRTATQRSEFVAAALASSTTPAAATVAGASPGAPAGAAAAKTEQATPAPSYARTAWLNGAAGAPRWTTAHGIFLSFELPRSRTPTAAATASSGSSSSSSSGSGSNGGSGLAVDKALRRAVAAVLAGAGTSGHLLVDALLPGLSANGFRDDTRDDAATGVEAGADRPRAVAASAQPATQGWNEGKRSPNPAMRVVDEMGEGGPVVEEVALLSSRSLATTPLHDLNRRRLQLFFHRLSDMPISVTRLATMLRWNLSVANAGDYSSLLYFLLLLGANPLLRRMKASHQSLRRANKVFAGVWGRDEAAARERGADDHDGAIRDAVRQELMAHDPTAFASLMRAPVAGTEAAASRASTRDGVPTPAASAPALQLRRALEADASVVAALTTVLRPVEELICVRVLPCARPGGTKLSAAAASSSFSSFLGFALHYIEVLPTWQSSPEEVVHYLRAQHEPSPTAAAADQPLDATWLESREEPHLLVWCVSHRWVNQRARPAAELYQRGLRNLRRRRGERDRRPPPPLVLSLRKLAVLLLWTHEYGAAMAAELLFVTLLTCPERVLLHPPQAAAAPAPAPVYASAPLRAPPPPTTDYGAWKVEFIE